jgi:hypothetical protein
MTRGIIDLAILALAAIAAVALMLKLFWPKAAHGPDAADNWEQHNELRAPSLENAAQAGDTAVDAAVAVQDMGIH